MNKAIFWDLLGTLGGNSHSLLHQNFEFFDEAIPALRIATQHDYLNVIITNQSHFAHGRITVEEYTQSLEKLISGLKLKDVQIASVYTCPHARKDNCECKKPKTKFIDEAVNKFDLNLDECIVIGDSGKNDMVMAKNAGIKSVLLLTGEGITSLTENRKLWDGVKPTFIAENCLDAVNTITKYI